MSAELRMDPHDDESARNFFLLDTSSPDAVGRASFPLVRRGYDPIEVQGFARAVSSELSRLQLEIADLRVALTEAERRAAVGIDEDVVLEFLGAESSRLLADARSTAHQVKARAEDQAARMVAEAESEAHSIRAEAQTFAADVRKAAEQRARELAAEAERNARSLVTSAKAESDQMIRDAEDHSANLVADAEERAALLVAEAERQREQVLDDLGERRNALSGQVDRLLGSREALAELISRVRTLADQSLDDLDDVEVDIEPLAGGLDHVGQVTMVRRDRIPAAG